MKRKMLNLFMVGACFLFAHSALYAQVGNLIIHSQPPGARVTVDGLDMGTTPMKVEVKAGNHKVIVALSGKTLEYDWYVGPGATLDKTVEFVKTDPGSGMEFVLIPAGSFMMGSESGDYNAKPAHRVQITKPFEMGKYEVTQAQWEKVMGSNPSEFKGDDLPVSSVLWEDVAKFISRLNDLNDGYRYRLPTEAEWEYACRAGTTGDYAGDLDEMAWYGDNSGKRTHPVGRNKPNAWGLYDMQGNVWEWCKDWYNDHYYSKSPESDPRGPDSGDERVIRGGSSLDDARWCTCTARFKFFPEKMIWAAGHPPVTYSYLGFRLVRVPQ
jgi:formylglycine-generating enzyme required for sulfatase activity